MAWRKWLREMHLSCHSGSKGSGEKGNTMFPKPRKSPAPGCYAQVHGVDMVEPAPDPSRMGKDPCQSDSADARSFQLHALISAVYHQRQS